MEAMTTPITAQEARQIYQVAYRLAYPEAYLAAKIRNNAKLSMLRRMDPEARAKHLEERKVYNQTHKEQRAAYERVYRARKRLERAEGVGLIGT